LKGREGHVIISIVSARSEEEERDAFPLTAPVKNKRYSAHKRGCHSLLLTKGRDKPLISHLKQKDSGEKKQAAFRRDKRGTPEFF